MTVCEDAVFSGCLWHFASHSPIPSLPMTAQAADLPCYCVPGDVDGDCEADVGLATGHALDDRVGDADDLARGVDKHGAAAMLELRLASIYRTLMGWLRGVGLTVCRAAITPAPRWG